MREILTILAIVLIVILTAALAVPYVIDWNNERHLVEAQLSNLTGADVKIRGGIDLKILPTPYLQLSDVELQDPAAGTDVKVAELHLEIALPSLMRGQVDFVEARFVAPDIHLQLHNGALPVWRPRHGFVGQMTFERIAVTHGRFVLDDPEVKRSYVFNDITLMAEADALTGPFRGDGHFEMGAAPTPFRFSTGARDGAKLPVKVTLDETADHPSFDLDGALIFDTNAIQFTLPTLTGTLHLTGASGPFNLPWQATGALDASLRTASVSNLDVQFGDDLATSLDGIANMDFGAAPRVALKLKAHQADLDRLLTAKDQPPPMRRLVATFRDAMTTPAVALFGFPISVSLTADTIILGGDALSDVAISVAPNGAQADGLKFSAKGPGGAHLTLDGQIETGSAPVFKGDIGAGVTDFARFRDWLTANLPDAAPPDLPIQTFGLEGAASISAVSAVGSNLLLDLNGSVLSGTLSYTKKIDANRARLFADLSAERLELTGLPDVSELARQVGDTDLALRLDARSVKLSGLKSGALETGQIQFDFAKTGANAQLKSFQLSGFNGADVAASGHWSPTGGGELALQLDAVRADEIASLAAQLAPGIETRFIAGHSGEFSPMHLAIALKGDATRVTGFSAAGSAGMTQFLASAQPAQNQNLDILLHAEAPEVRPLLRQFGFTTLSGKRLGQAVINASAQGNFGHLSATLSATLADTMFEFAGGIDKIDAAPQASGTVRIASSDLSGLLRATGFAGPDAHITLPLDLHAAAQADRSGLRLDALTATCGPDKASGTLSYAADRGLTGSLRTDRLSLGTLLQISLGPPQPTKNGALWSDRPFAAPLKLPAALVSIHTGTFAIAPSVEAGDSDFNLLLGGSDIALQHFSGKLNSGRVLADLAVRRDGATASIEGHVTLNHYALDVPTARGFVDGKLDFAGTGQSAMGLVAGVAGAGTLSISDLLLARSSPTALAQIVSDVEEERLSIDETEIDRALADAFDRHPLSADTANFDIGLAAGALRFTGKSATPAGAGSDVTELTQASLDLTTRDLAQSTLLTLTALPRNWAGAPPQVTLNWTGPLDRPERNLDATSFVDALAARAIARETARIEAQEFDVHEHAVALDRVENIRREEDDRQRAIEDVKQAAARATERAATLDRLRQLLASEQRKAAETVQPLPIAPPMPQVGPKATAVPAPSPAQAAPPAAADPSAAGRY